jgi:hypothetical protein
MTRCRRLAERLRRPAGAALALLGVVVLAEAIWVGRGAQAYAISAAVIISSPVSLILPDRTRPLHPPGESTIQWAKRRRR